VVDGLRARQGELVEAIFVRVRAGALAGSGDEGAEYVAGLRAAVVAAVEYVLEGIERGEGWAGPIPAVASEQARRAARTGVSLDTVLRRYLVGHTLFEQFVMEEADRSGENGIPPPQREALRVALRGALRAQAAVLDRLLERIAEEHGDELARIGRSPEQRRAERVRRLLEGGTVEEAGLDYELADRWHLGVIATGTGAAQAVRELAVRADRRLLSVAQGQENVWAWLGGRERFAVGALERVIGMGSHPPEDGMGSHQPEGGALPGAGGTVVAAGGAPSPSDVVLALGEPARGIEGWRLTHQQAQAALVVALRRGGRGGVRRAVTRYADVALLATALKDELLGRALVEVYLDPLEDARDSGPMLRETLRAYLAAERSVSSTAAALGVTRSTVESRLRRVEQNLGRLLPACLAELDVALRLEELGGLTSNERRLPAT
jgi:hypothetical protein